MLDTIREAYTPEGVALRLPAAGPLPRALAWGIDAAIRGAVLLTGLTLFGLLGSSGLGLFLVLVFASLWIYPVLFEVLHHGQTPGKRAVGLRVITLTGQPITPYDAILRNLLRIVDQLPGIYAVGVLSIFFTEKSPRIGDLVAGTVVVQEASGSARALQHVAAATVRLGAARLTADELEVIETFLGRRDDIPDDVRRRTASQLASRIRERLNLVFESYRDDERLIESIAAEYRGR
jgi:uncharacterized RDD family membrane protein YckC